MLLDSIEQLKIRFATQINAVTTAASQGIFSWEGDSDPQEIIREILTYLREQTQGHATFLAAIEPDIPDDFSLVLEKLQAQIRRKQWHMPTVTIPEFQQTRQECFLDGWRPGTELYRVDPQIRDARISAATAFRRDRGRRLKHKLFYELLGDEKYKDNLCTKDLGELAANPSKGLLNGKIAFIHIDGNSFGAIRHERCTTPEARQQFDQRIQNNFRQPFLKSLLQLADDDVDFTTRDSNGNQALRIEVLLWGGDEMTLVVPAWKGLQVLQHFYAQAKDLDFDKVPLTHRAAIIFCHHNAPLQQIRRVAEELLAQTRKDIVTQIQQTRGEAELHFDHELGDALHYLVLESFDMLRGSLSSFLAQYYKQIAYQHLLLYGNELNDLQKNLNILRRNLSRGRVLEMISALQIGDEAGSQHLWGRITRSVPLSSREEVNKALDALLDDNPTRLYLLADLWDYIPEWKP